MILNVCYAADYLVRQASSQQKADLLRAQDKVGGYASRQLHSADKRNSGAELTHQLTVALGMASIL